MSRSQADLCERKAYGVTLGEPVCAMSQLRRRTVANIRQELQADYEIIKRLDAIVNQNFGSNSLGPPVKYKGRFKALCSYNGYERSKSQHRRHCVPLCDSITLPTAKAGAVEDDHHSSKDQSKCC